MSIFYSFLIHFILVKICYLVYSVESDLVLFNALAENGTVQMSFKKIFWTERFSMLNDRFSTPWMINCAPVV
jgi:uncharacterized glyoxalase superfamily protein PhnB